MEMKIEQQNGQVQVTFSGPLTIEHASAMREALHNVLRTAEKVVLDFRQAVAVDLACLQTLCSAHRTAEALGKGFSMNANSSESFLRIVENSGYVRYSGCLRDKTRSCLWVEKYRENHS